ncbi:MAG: tetratricopeptide repeat protein [Planctomycetes bacterium]|nr:tetratricopeptide repeat protein [Planctomycetota bacterium]
MRNPIPCACLAAALLLAPAGAAEPGAEDVIKTQEYLCEGAQILVEKDYARALSRFNSAIKLSPGNPEGYYWAALTYSEMQNFGAAEQRASQAVAIDPKMANAWLLWGQQLLFLGKFAEAREKLEEADRLAPNNFTTQFVLGLYYFHNDKEGKPDYTAALKHFSRARDLNPRYLPAIYYMALCQMEKGMHALAEDTLRNVIKAAPRNTDAHYRLGAAYRMDNQTEKALQEFITTVRLDPRHYESHLQLAHIYLTENPNKDRFWYHLKEYLKYAPADHVWRNRAEELVARSQRPRQGAAPAPAAPGS